MSLSSPSEQSGSVFSGGHTVTFGFIEQLKSLQSMYMLSSLSQPSMQAASSSSGPLHASTSGALAQPKSWQSVYMLPSLSIPSPDSSGAFSPLPGSVFVMPHTVTIGFIEHSKSSQSVNMLPSLSKPSEHATSLSSGPSWPVVIEDDVIEPEPVEGSPVSASSSLGEEFAVSVSFSSSSGQPSKRTIVAGSHPKEQRMTWQPIPRSPAARKAAPATPVTRADVRRRKAEHP